MSGQKTIKTIPICQIKAKNSYPCKKCGSYITQSLILCHNCKTENHHIREYTSNDLGFFNHKPKKLTVVDNA